MLISTKQSEAEEYKLRTLPDGKIGCYLSEIILVY